ncbi:hypothetical protein AX16_002761 [Volvariella volvacea WC 439]|nr:hypothetical protein AX16_002761 [Volvariella volvacea WC 439]
MLDSQAESGPSRGRGRGRGRSRGGLGKYLRAQGRGRGRGRPAEFSQRLVLEHEQEEELDEEELAVQRKRYSRRQLTSNADRYVEPEPELGSDGEPVVEPEVDLSNFLERQRISEGPSPSLDVAAPKKEDIDDDDIDHTLDHILPGSSSNRRNEVLRAQKGRVTQIEWDEELEVLSREKAAADATRDLKARFKTKVDNLKTKPAIPQKSSNKSATIQEAPPIPGEDATLQRKSSKEKMEDFLDDLLG